MRLWHALLLGSALVAPRVVAQDAIPAGFELSVYAAGLLEPVAMELAPDGRLFVAERGGTIRIVSDGVPAATPFATIDVFYENENGLLGLTLDPDFAATHYVYVFATVSNRESQILRFTDKDGVGDDRTIVRDHLPTRGGFHSGGGLKVGPDRKLYFSIGDNQEPENSQDMNTLAGKISRINLDGSVPADNPFTTPTGSPRAVFAIGFRNPFRFCFAPDGRLFAMDVGSDNDERREEVNLVSAGGNYGWPLVEGRQVLPDPRFTDPIFDYHDGGAAPVGGVYYTGAQFPAEYRGNLFFIEYVLNRIYSLELSGDRVARATTFLEAEGGPIDLLQMPDGSLLYSELQGGRIMRLRYAAGSDGTAGEVLSAVEEATPPTSAGLCGFGAIPALALTLAGIAAFRTRSG
ncbi:MAG: PQQ-dependent sugar dehydrogenase [Phycisphaerae bacterium]